MMTTTKRKRPSLAREVRTLRESLAADRIKLHALGLWSDDAAPLRAQVHTASDRLTELQRKLKIHQQRDAQRNLARRAAGIVKARPRKPARTVTDDLLSRQKAVTTIKARLAALPEGTDAWFRMVEALRIETATVLKCERMVALCAE